MCLKSFPVSASLSHLEAYTKTLWQHTPEMLQAENGRLIGKLNLQIGAQDYYPYAKFENINTD